MDPPEFPFLFGLCITGKSPFHLQYFLPNAIQAFAEQAYPPERRSLVLVVERGEDRAVAYGLCTEYLRPLQIGFSVVEAQPPLGNLRNAALDEAQRLAEGQRHLVIQWDDDDWHHPERMAQQVQHWRGAPERPCFLQRQLTYSFTHDSAYVREFPGTFIHGTILHVNEPRIRYPVQAKEEDTVFLGQWPEATVVQNDPVLYVRFDHGANTWDHEHIMREAAGARGDWQVDTGQAEFLREVLAEYTLPPPATSATAECPPRTASAPSELRLAG